MRLSANGAHFDSLDEGSGPALILLHGFPLAKETDLRGLENSAATPGPYLMEALAGDVAAIMDLLRIERAAIVGHSLGGYVAYAFWRMFAERCTDLGIICSRASADDAAAADARRALADRAEREGIEPVVDAFVPRFFAPEICGAAGSRCGRTRTVHIIAGRRDAFIPVEEAGKARAISSAIFHEFKCGHFPMWEAPAQTTAVLEALSAASSAAQRSA